MRTLDLADFRDADLAQARFDGAVLAGAQFSDATNVPQAILESLDANQEVPVGDGNRPPGVPQ